MNIIDKIDNYLNENYSKYICRGCNYYYDFINKYKEYYNKNFEEYVISNNKADRDAGELSDICKSEIIRLSKEYKMRQINEYHR